MPNFIRKIYSEYFIYLTSPSKFPISWWWYVNKILRSDGALPKFIKIKVKLYGKMFVLSLIFVMGVWVSIPTVIDYIKNSRGYMACYRFDYGVIPKILKWVKERILK